VLLPEDFFNIKLNNYFFILLDSVTCLTRYFCIIYSAIKFENFFFQALKGNFWILLFQQIRILIHLIVIAFFINNFIFFYFLNGCELNFSFNAIIYAFILNVSNLKVLGLLNSTSNSTNTRPFMELGCALFALPISWEMNPFTFFDSNCLFNKELFFWIKHVFDYSIFSLAIIILFQFSCKNRKKSKTILKDLAIKSSFHFLLTITCSNFLFLSRESSFYILQKNIELFYGKMCILIIYLIIYIVFVFKF
jgi:hypothetical protein